jgi:hypothetical protein
MSFTGLAQNPVKDNNKINQLKSMEFMQWKFTPEEYYYSWYKQKVLWWTVKLPGLGIHDKGIGGIGGGDNYVNKYGNNIKQYTPAIASVVLQRQEAKKQEEETKIVYNQELAKFADREVDYAYTLTASRRNELKNEFIQLLMKYASDNSFSNEREKNCKTLVFEYDRILANVKIINESHMSNATKREAYLECEQELVELIALVTRLSNLNNVLKLK